MTLRKRLEHSRKLTWFVGLLARAYLTLCYRTTRWEGTGLEEIKAALGKGPVILVVWHGHLLLGPFHWPRTAGQLSTIHTSSPIGRVAGEMQRQYGLHPFEMSEKISNLATSRQILKRVAAGTSIGITADGPLGPALAVKDPPVEWARATGCPVFCYAFSTQRAKRLSSWDRMLLPLPFTHGRFIFAPFSRDIPRKLDAAAQEALKADLQSFMLEKAMQVDKDLLDPEGGSS